MHNAYMYHLCAHLLQFLPFNPRVSEVYSSDGDLDVSIVANGGVALRKHAYSNILKNSPPKNENFQIKKI